MSDSISLYILRSFTVCCKFRFVTVVALNRQERQFSRCCWNCKSNTNFNSFLYPLYGYQGVCPGTNDDDTFNCLVTSTTTTIFRQRCLHLYSLGLHGWQSRPFGWRLLYYCLITIMIISGSLYGKRTLFWWLAFDD